MKTIVGKIVSNKMEKTVIVLSERLWEHPKYLKRIKRSSKFFAHSDKKIKVGETVKIVETKPLSKNINWKVIEIVKTN